MVSGDALRITNSNGKKRPNRRPQCALPRQERPFLVLRPARLQSSRRKSLRKLRSSGDHFHFRSYIIMCASAIEYAFSGERVRSVLACHAGVPVAFQLRTGGLLDLVLWRTSGASLAANCHLWCTSDGRLPLRGNALARSGRDDLLRRMVKGNRPERGVQVCVEG